MEDTVTSAEEFLIKRRYRKYPGRPEYPYMMKNLYEHRLTDLETNSVCETNDRLCIHINEYQFKDSHPQYEVSIVAERHSLWWDLKAYSLNAEELVNKIESIENNLIAAFNSLKP